MFASLLGFQNSPCLKQCLVDKDLELALVPAGVLDAALAISALVIGILGAIGKINMPPAATYSLIGAAGLIAIFDLGLLFRELFHQSDTYRI